MKPHTEKLPFRTKPNYLYSIVSVTLVLFLLGFFGFILLYAQRVVTIFKERVNVLVELKTDADSMQVIDLEDHIRQLAGTRRGSVAFVSKEEAARQMREVFGEDFVHLDMPNPFYDMVSFNVRAQYMNPDSLETIRTELREWEAVNDVFYQENLAGKIGGNIKKIGYLALGMGLFFIFVAITLIHNTIRLALYANRFLIKNMELVGASWEFISRPYIIRAVWQGLLSGILATIVLGSLLFWLVNTLPELKKLQMNAGLVLLLLSLVVLGVLINTWSTYYIVKKYLRLRVDDLY